MKKIVYLTQRYRPPLEATSKEITLLSQHFKGEIFNIHLDGLFKIKLNKEIISHHFLYYPLTLPFLYLTSKDKIIHIYSNLCDRPYLPIFKSKNTILSSTNFISKEKIITRLKDINSVKKIIVQSELQKKELIDVGISSHNISLIYPPVNLKDFSYTPASNNQFTLLCATTPEKISALTKRGIYLLLECDLLLKDTKIKLLLRANKKTEPIINHSNPKNIITDSQIYQDMNQQYAQIHATLIPYLQLDGYLKLIPTSAAESLAAGKPLIVSSQTGIAEIVIKEHCGVVFEPTAQDFLKAIEKLKKNYKVYQQNSRKAAEKYFSKTDFIKKHEEIYQEMSQHRNQKGNPEINKK